MEYYTIYVNTLYPYVHIIICINDMEILIHKLYLLVVLSLMETVLEQMDFACMRQTVENQSKHFSTKRKAIVSKTYAVIIIYSIKY